MVAWLEACTPNKLLARAELNLSGKKSNISSLFEKASDSDTGRLNADSLSPLLQKCGLLLSDSAAEALWAHLDRDDKGSIDWATFEQLFGEDLIDKVTMKHETAEWVEDWLSQLREALTVSFEAIWDHFDGDKNGELNDEEMNNLVTELLQVLDSSKIPSVTQVNAVKGKIGAGGRRSLDKARLKTGLIKYIEDEFRGRLQDGRYSGLSWADIAGIFGEFDRNGDGVVSIEEFKCTPPSLSKPTLANLSSHLTFLISPPNCTFFESDP